ncbi:hypothetical protein QBC43DRAFT_97854 [Cladorrhinum sp. PSN259]|nr:hypothetical protein QBC43DRAFT_97854 [Cladorrhinum sp. PSN259]
MNVRSGHFLRQDPAAFDAPFFSISQSEANSLDPDQRSLLETSYHALESAGLPVESLAGTNTSVFVGTFAREYGTFWTKDPMQPPKYAGTGTGPALLANRLSWFYDLRGTSITLDTACSSSMIALHLACESLRAGTSDAALVAGSNLILNPETAMIPLTNLGFLSPDGRCYAFDHRANGYGRGEGYAVLVLKRLQDAVRAGDTIRAVIRATGTNQNGRSPAIVQPRPEAQADLIRQTYASAGLPLHQTRFFEAHGTGTAVGDPIEASAIAQVFAPHRSTDSPLYVGAVKSNIGHLEGASALAGLVKVILSLENGVVPPNINMEKVNPRIPSKKWHMTFPTEPIPWPHGHDGATHSIRRASVNSFGYGGSNAHAILDDAASYLAAHGLKGVHRTRAEPALSSLSSSSSSANKEDKNGSDVLPPGNARTRLLVWSAADENGIQRLGREYLSYLDARISSLKDSNSHLDEIAYTLASKRSILPWKSYLLTSSLTQLRETLGAMGLPKPSRSSTASSSAAPSLAFVFTGQGAQWYAMGRELLVYAVFKESVEAADQYIQSELSCAWSVVQELLQRSEKDTNVDKAAYSQCLCTVLQIALVDLLRCWGVHAAAVVGHSSGEIAAAYCAGGLSRESAWKTAYFRGTVAAELELQLLEAGNPGAMMAVGLSVPELTKYLDRLDDAVSVGCINGPTNTTVTGTEKGVVALQTELEEENVFCRRLRVALPYHSWRMSNIAVDYTRALEGICPGSSTSKKLPIMYSSLTGTVVYPETLSSPDYWVKNLTSTVRFSEAVERLASTTGIAHFVEVGPTAALKRPVQESVGSSSKMVYYSVLARNQPASQTALAMAGQLFCNGYPVNIAAINVPPGEKTDEPVSMAINLPCYPFNHSKLYWEESRISKNFRHRKHPRHELLGTQTAEWNKLEPRWRNFLRVSESSWLLDHKFNGSAIYPAAGMIVMAIEAARQLAKPPTGRIISGFRIRDMMLTKALLLSAEPGGVEIQLTLRPKNAAGGAVHDASHFNLYQFSNNEHVEICSGTIIVEYEDLQGAAEVELEEAELALQESRRQYEAGLLRCRKTVQTTQMYENLSSMGFSFGPAFQTLHDVRFNDNGEAKATIKLREWAGKVNDARIQPHVIHPAPLDGVFHLAIVASTKGGWNRIPTMVPTMVQDFWISNDLLTSGSSACLGVHAQRFFAGIRDESFSMVAVDKETGRPRITVAGYRGTAVSSLRDGGPAMAALTRDGPRRICYGMDWKPDIDLLSEPELARYCMHTELQLNKPEEQHNLQLCELLCLYYIKQALEGANESNPPAHKPHLRRYVEWMAHHLSTSSAQARLASPEGVRFFVDDEYRNAFLRQAESGGSDAQLYMTLVRHLPQILSGEADALALLFGEQQLMAKFYESDWFAASYAQMATYMDLLAHKDSNLHILEVGAGTGATTGPILAKLGSHGPDGEAGTPRLASYTYTDISASFFGTAKERFEDAFGDRLNFKTLDIGVDPGTQGFEQGFYDVVVASNVLHATPNLATSLDNVRRLLRPGGKLVLFEVTDKDVTRVTFAFGTLPGWWLGGEDGRQWGPLLSREEWHDMLRKHGFSGIDLILGNIEGPNHTYSVMVSEAVPTVNGVLAGHDSEPPSDTPLANRETTTVIVADPDEPLQQEVASVLMQEIPQDTQVISPQALATHPLDHTTCIFLPELTRPFLATIKQDEFENLKKLVAAAASVLWVTSGGGEKIENPHTELATGFGRSMCSERPFDLKFCNLSLEDTCEVPPIIENIVKVHKKLVSLPPGDPLETHYMQRSNQLHIGRIVEANHLNNHVHRLTANQEPKPEAFGGGDAGVDVDNTQDQPNHRDRALSLVMGAAALLDTLHFVHDPDRPSPLADHEIEVRVQASGLNFKDVMVAIGQLPNATIGIECAGIVTRIGSKSATSSDDIRVGDRVVCLTSNGSFKTYARAHVDTVAPIPPNMSFAEAASIPVAYLTAYYSLVETARLQAGETVLIHAGAGGVGQAAIQVARMVGAGRVLATVSTEAKKALLVREYGVDPADVFSSRKLSFAQGVKRRTGGRGADVVLNSLAGDALRESWRCLAPMGRFVEIGKRDIILNETLPMSEFNGGTTFAAFDLDVVRELKSRQVGQVLRKVMAWVCEGKLNPQVPLHRYPVSEIESAFRGLQSGKLAGKVVVEMKQDSIVPVVPTFQNRYSFDANASYVIAGGMGGLGRSLARWFASRGARHLILLSRSGLDTSAAQSLADELARLGVNIAAPSCDVSDADALRLALADCTNNRGMPPVKGCVQCAMVLRDSIFQNMTHADFHAALRPKVQASWNLHKQLPADLSFFILLSSLAGLAGNSGQSNYVAGNTYQDALARHRLVRGQSAASIDVGMMVQVGLVAESIKVAENLMRVGYMAIYEAELLSLMDRLCDPDPARRAAESPLSGQIPIGITTPGMFRRKGYEEKDWMRRPEFCHLRQMDLDDDSAHCKDAGGQGEGADTNINYEVALAKAQSLSAAAELVQAGLIRKLSRALFIPEQDIDPAAAVHVAGVDSLVAVELKYWFLKETHAEVAVFNILGNDSLHDLCVFAVKKSPLWKGEGSLMQHEGDGKDIVIS